MASPSYLHENFLLQTKTAAILYHDYAKEMPIIDYHNHLPPQQIAENQSFENISKILSNGDTLGASYVLNTNPFLLLVSIPIKLLHKQIHPKHSEINFR